MRSPARPTVSVIIPTHNSGETIAECLKSIKNQSYADCEIIVVDDFSSDNTIRTAEKFQARIIQRKCNPAFARNIGIANSVGRYVLLQDSDQALAPSVVEQCVRKCENELVGMVRIPEIFVGKGFWGSCSAVWKNSYEVIERSHGKEVTVFSGEPRFFVRELVTQVGMFNTKLVWGEDYNLYKRLKKAGIKEATCRSCIYHYELVSIKDILIKDLRYGKSMPIFVQETQEKVLSQMFKRAFLVFRRVSKDFSGSPRLIVGCAFLLYLKTSCMMIGLMAGFAT